MMKHGSTTSNSENIPCVYCGFCVVARVLENFSFGGQRGAVTLHGSSALPDSRSPSVSAASRSTPRPAPDQPARMSGNAIVPGLLEVGGVDVVFPDSVDVSASPRHREARAARLTPHRPSQ